MEGILSFFGGYLPQILDLVGYLLAGIIVRLLYKFFKLKMTEIQVRAIINRIRKWSKDISNDDDIKPESKFNMVLSSVISLLTSKEKALLETYEGGIDPAIERVYQEYVKKAKGQGE